MKFLTEEDYYKQCFVDYFEKLYGYAFTIVRDNSEAKDVVQSAFINLWKKRANINIANSGRSYLYTSVYHLALNVVRNRKTKEHHHQKLAIKETYNILYTAEQKEIRIRIQKAIDDLPPRCREAFYKNRFEEKTYQEIADEMNISIKTVEVQMGKALKILRENLADITMLIMLLLLK